jgi:hypothetical protein
MNQQRRFSVPRVAWALAISFLLGFVAFFIVPNSLRPKGHVHSVNPARTVRTLTTAEVVYADTNKQLGYSPNLAALGLSEDRSLSAARSEGPPLKTPYTKSQCERLPLLGDVFEHN